MTVRRSTTSLLWQRLRSLAALFAYFAQPNRIVLLIPVMLLVLIGGGLLIVMGGLSYVAPFVYTLF